MASGKSGYVTASGKSTLGGNFEFRLGWSEEYDIATNESVVTLISCDARYAYGGYFYPSGTISVDGAEVIAMDGEGASHRFETVYGGETWAPIKSWATHGAIPPWTTGQITHNVDGSKSVNIGINLSFWRSSDDKVSINTTIAIELTTIPRASSITSAGAVTLGNKCSVKWTPKAASFRYKLKFSIGTWSYTTDAIHPNKTTEHTYSGYAIPLDAAKQIPNAKTGTMTVELFTYSDSDASVQVGSADSETFTITVPDNSDTKPAVTMLLAPVSSLAAQFDGLYIQGKTKVKAELTASGSYGASIGSCSMKVENVSYDSEDGYISEYLASSGEITVSGYAKDSRGISGSTSQTITVIAYSKPKIVAVSGENEVVAARCDADGNLSNSGTYLKIKAKRSYSPVTSNGGRNNLCYIRFRYKLESAETYGEWEEILAGDEENDEIETGALLGGMLAAKHTYLVQIQAIDDIGESSITTVSVMTEEAYMHRTKNAMGLGKYVEGENLLDVAWNTHLRGEVKIGAEGLTLKEYILAVISEGG